MIERNFFGSATSVYDTKRFYLIEKEASNRRCAGRSGGGGNCQRPLENIRSSATETLDTTQCRRHPQKRNAVENS